MFLQKKSASFIPYSSWSRDAQEERLDEREVYIRSNEVRRFIDANDTQSHSTFLY